MNILLVPTIMLTGVSRLKAHPHRSTRSQLTKAPTATTNMLTAMIHLQHMRNMPIITMSTHMSMNMMDRMDTGMSTGGLRPICTAAGPGCARSKSRPRACSWFL